MISRKPESTTQAAVDPESLVFRAPRKVPASPQRGPNATSVWWWFGMLVCAVLFILLIRTLLERTAWSAGDNPPSVQSTPSESLPGPSGEPAALMDDPPVGTQPDGNTAPTTQAAPPRPQTAAGSRESRRRADEAIKLLEATTPEM